MKHQTYTSPSSVLPLAPAPTRRQWLQATALGVLGGSTAVLAQPAGKNTGTKPAAGAPVASVVQIVDMSAEQQDISRDLVVGARAAWQSFNAQGGLKGRPVLHRVLDQLKTGFRDGVSYEDLYQRLLYGADCPADQYLLLADFASYCAASHRVVDTYADREKWNRMSLHNIARSGIFSADRSIADYADTIWHVPYKK